MKNDKIFITIANSQYAETDYGDPFYVPPDGYDPEDINKYAYYVSQFQFSGNADVQGITINSLKKGPSFKNKFYTKDAITMFCYQTTRPATSYIYFGAPDEMVNNIYNKVTPSKVSTVESNFFKFKKE